MASLGGGGGQVEIETLCTAVDEGEEPVSGLTPQVIAALDKSIRKAVALAAVGCGGGGRGACAL